MSIQHRKITSTTWFGSVTTRSLPSAHRYMCMKLNTSLSFYQIIDVLLEMTPLLNKTVFQVVSVQIQTHLLIDDMGGWRRWALVSPDGVAPSRMVGVSASVNLPLHHKVQKFSSGTGSPGWSWGPGERAVNRLWCGVTDRCCTVHSQLNRYQLSADLVTAAATTIYSKQPLINFLHLLCSIASCFFRCQAWQSFFSQPLSRFSLVCPSYILHFIIHMLMAPLQVW